MAEDADYAGGIDMRTPTTGFVFKVYGGAVVWGSKRKVPQLILLWRLSLELPVML